MAPEKAEAAQEVVPFARDILEHNRTQPQQMMVASGPRWAWLLRRAQETIQAEEQRDPVHGRIPA
ncbi:MAG: hypothetical protein ACREBW_07980 [Candidatus Micrarchaeaceae archaeon]